MKTLILVFNLKFKERRSLAEEDIEREDLLASWDTQFVTGRSSSRDKPVNGYFEKKGQLSLGSWVTGVEGKVILKA